jgi:hypothetical protein
MASTPTESSIAPVTVALTARLYWSGTGGSVPRAGEAITIMSARASERMTGNRAP